METAIYDAKYWRSRAAEIRAVAEGISDPISKNMLLQIEEDYNQLAEKSEGSEDNQRSHSGRVREHSPPRR